MVLLWDIITVGLNLEILVVILKDKFNIVLTEFVKF